MSQFMNTIAISIQWGMSPPRHHQGHHLAPHLLVSTAQSMTRYPLDASTGTQPSTKPQRQYLVSLVLHKCVEGHHKLGFQHKIGIS